MPFAIKIGKKYCSIRKNEWQFWAAVADATRFATESEAKAQAARMNRMDPENGNLRYQVVRVKATKVKGVRAPKFEDSRVAHAAAKTAKVYTRRLAKLLTVTNHEQDRINAYADEYDKSDEWRIRKLTPFVNVVVLLNDKVGDTIADYLS